LIDRRGTEHQTRAMMELVQITMKVVVRAVQFKWPNQIELELAEYSFDSIRN
jgi:hypothetical protein